jgi:hypothetical protein
MTNSNRPLATVAVLAALGLTLPRAAGGQASPVTADTLLLHDDGRWRLDGGAQTVRLAGKETVLGFRPEGA